MSYRFAHNGCRFQVTKAMTQDRARLWILTPGATVWELGHGKDIPAGWSLQMVAKTMRQFMTGAIDHGEYNARLPY